MPKNSNLSIILLSQGTARRLWLMDRGFLVSQFCIGWYQKKSEEGCFRQQLDHSCHGDVHCSLDLSILGVGSKFVWRTVSIVTNWAALHGLGLHFAFDHYFELRAHNMWKAGRVLTTHSHSGISSTPFFQYFSSIAKVANDTRTYSSSRHSNAYWPVLELCCLVRMSFFCFSE